MNAFSREQYEHDYDLVTQAYADYLVFLNEHQGRTNTCGPHCDSFVLHSPTACDICDKYASDLQHVRHMLHIAFTDEQEVPPGTRPCPATLLRPVETIEHWGGNVVVTHTANIGEAIKSVLFPQGSLS